MPCYPTNWLKSFFLYSVTHCESIVFTDINECNDDVCDANANCTNTNGSHNCICKEGYIGDGQSCQCILEQQYLMLSKAPSITSIVFVTRLMIKRQGNGFHAPYLVFLLSYGYHNIHRYTVFAGLKYFI